MSFEDTRIQLTCNVHNVSLNHFFPDDSTYLRGSRFNIGSLPILLKEGSAKMVIKCVRILKSERLCPCSALHKFIHRKTGNTSLIQLTTHQFTRVVIQQLMNH